jgi:hypothetical protein
MNLQILSFTLVMIGTINHKSTRNMIQKSPMTFYLTMYRDALRFTAVYCGKPQ